MTFHIVFKLVLFIVRVEALFLETMKDAKFH